MTLAKLRLALLSAAGLLACAAPLAVSGLEPASAAPPAKPNILFVILDDVGIDQMPAFGFGGANPPKMPNVETLVQNGIAFTNAWAMPECSPSRAAFFSGRYPERTGVVSAIVDNHLPQDYLSSYESTLPRILSQAGYTSSMVGKYHLGNDKDPAGNCAPQTRGWDNFQGNMTPGPPSIDLTAGGTDPNATTVCGYVQTADPGGCYRLDKNQDISCRYIDAANAQAGTTPARSCLQQGGIFTANLTCGQATPTTDDFANYNAYYVWPRFAMRGAKPPAATPACDPSTVDRRYMTTAQSDDGASWWNKQTGPRMLTLSFNAMHTPFQKASTSVVPDLLDRTSTCNSSAPQRFLLNSILEGADVEIGRFLADAGLADLDPTGRTITKLKLKDTMVVIVGDNGSFGPTVRAQDGFSAPRSKATIYQTGVWVPLVVTGPLVSEPGRKVDELVNVVDLFNLFGAVAGVNVDTVVPPSRVLDAKPLLPYLTSASAEPIRETSFTQVAAGTFTPDPEERSYPCSIAGVCNDTLFATEGLCLDQAGTWYGPGGATQATSCCAVAAANPGTTIIPPSQYATRNKRYKLAEIVNTDCSAPLAAGETGAFPWAEYQTTKSYEFYDIQQTAANPLGMDNSDANYLADCPSGTDPRSCLPKNLRPAYDQLRAVLDRVKSSTQPQMTCATKGDGNLDLFVNELDVSTFETFRGKGPSRYDINLDGETNNADLKIIKANQGTDCMDQCARADLNRDGKVGNRDMSLLQAQFGRCAGDKEVLCGGDLNGDARVNNVDVDLMRSAERSCQSKDEHAEALP
jgi:arylsulfatase A-like enzyme